MNYQRIYDRLITKATARIPPKGYIEHHHIIPRCMNGSDEKENIAILTPEEHFIAHVLLVKIHPEIPKLIGAVSRMCKGKGRKRRKLYGWLRRRHAEYMKLNQSGSNNSQYGTMWIHQGIENRRIKKDEAIPEGWKKGRQIVIRSNVCERCGTNFTTENNSIKFCSKECRKSALQERISNNWKNLEYRKIQIKHCKERWKDEKYSQHIISLTRRNKKTTI